MIVHPTQNLFAIQVSVEVPLEVLARVVESQLLVDAVDLLDILRFKFEVALEVLDDSAFGLALGKHASPV